MWTAEHRKEYDRRGLRYPSDLTDREWALIERLIPPAKRGGRRRAVSVRETVNAIFYVLATGCQWRALPKDFPPKSTVWEYLDLWDYDGTLDRIHATLFAAARWQERRTVDPSAAIVDSQSVKSAEKGGLVPHRRATTRRRRSRARSATLSSTSAASS
jgi:transposase